MNCLANHKLSLRTLEANYRKVHGLAGATILGDGRIAMILDIYSLVSLAASGNSESYAICHEEAQCAEKDSVEQFA